MTADVALDANVLVGLLDPGDALHSGAQALIDGMGNGEAAFLLLDFIVEEALSVLCRRAQQRKASPPNLESAIETVREWYVSGWVRESALDLAAHIAEILDIVSDSEGRLNVNDAKLVFLQRSGKIGSIGTFDQKLAAVPGLRCIASPT
jgi:predicted nucleic acid-binding protein